MKISPAKVIKIAIIDDSEVVRMGLRTLLSAEENLLIVGEASTVKSALELAFNNPSEVMLVDIRLPDGTGFEVCRKVIELAPETRVLFLTSVVDDRLIEEAIRAGAHGYLLKEINGRGLIQAIVDIAEGKSILDPAVTTRVMNLMKTGGSDGSLASLSPQERRVIASIAEGKTNKEVGVELGLSEKTVKNYLSTIFEKLNVSRRSQAAALYAKTRLSSY